MGVVSKTVTQVKEGGVIIYFYMSSIAITNTIKNTRQQLTVGDFEGVFKGDIK